MRQLRLILRIVILLVIAAFQPECGSKQTIAGGTSTSENAHVSGTIVDSLGLAAAKTVVYLIPTTYNPVTDSLSNLILIDTTDAAGNYAFDSITAGNYNILATQPTTGTRLLVNNIKVSSDSLYRNADTLRATATLKITIPDTVINTKSYVYIPGTTLVGYSASSDNGVITITIDSVPTTTTPTVYYVKNSGTSQPQKLDSNNIVVFRNDTTKTRNNAWMYHKTLYLNTSASGADISRTITNFPVLVRLTKSNFNFSQASGKGYDIRFTKSNNTPLHYEIETWDSAQGYAAVWVKLDTILPNNTTQNILMHWGNMQTTSIDSSSSTAVFDTSAGFVGVWHMSQSPTNVLLDATAHHYNGTAYGAAKASTDYMATVVGTAQTFDGKSTYYELNNTELSALNFPEKSAYSISAWIYVDSLNQTFHPVFSKGNQQYSLQINNSNSLEFVEFESTKGWNSTFSGITGQSWVYATGVRNGNAEYLYINGVMADSIIKISSSPNMRTSLTACIGRYDNVSPFYFKGAMDEVRIESRARSASWIKLCYKNQQHNDKLIISGTH